MLKLFGSLLTTTAGIVAILAFFSLCYLSIDQSWIRHLCFGAIFLFGNALALLRLEESASDLDELLLTMNIVGSLSGFPLAGVAVGSLPLAVSSLLSILLASILSKGAGYSE